MATAKKAGINVAAVQKILAMLKQRREEDAALIDELERLIGGGQGIGEIMKQLYADWNELWSQTHGGAYVFNFTIDAPNMKRLVRQLGQEELTARFAGYMRDRDDWLMRNKHPFGAFVKQSNRYASTTVSGSNDLVMPAVGCTHQPPCTSDQEHTRRKRAELAGARS